MTYLIGALFAFAFAFTLGRWLARAPVAAVTRAVRWSLVVIVVVGLLFVVWAGRYQLTAVILPLLLPMLMRWWHARQMRRAADGPRPGARSRIDTAFLSMSLDHDSGGLDGEVVGGRYAGRRLGALTLAELMQLRDECRADEASLRILDAYLDRVHGAAWRASSDQSRGESPRGESPSQAMTRDEAYAILGLQPDASEDAIKQAHRRLMAQVHPDRGGSGYLAALINSARDLLLGR